MIPRIIDINANGKYISKKRGAMIIADKGETTGEVPLEDIGVLMVSAFGATFSKEILVCLAAQGAITILCGENGHPAAYVAPINGNYEMAQRIKVQIDASGPLKKRLWQSIVKAKLRHQSAILCCRGDSKNADKLSAYENHVLSGDSDNREAVGARVYWRSLMGKGFRRDPKGEWPNALFNYGYTVLRASTARAICAAGLLPSMGIQHKSAINSFALADDLMEPYRPLVDFYVMKALEQGAKEVNPESKKTVTNFLWADLSSSGRVTPFFSAMESMAVSLVKSFKEKKPKIEIASMVLSDKTI